MSGPDLASVFAALAEVPGRLAALEREVAALRADTTGKHADIGRAVADLRSALPPSLLSVAETAALFRVSAPTVRRWVRAGKVPVVRVGSAVRVDVSNLRGHDARDVEALARQAQAATPACVNRNRP